jgi:hypothetical protein
LDATIPAHPFPAAPSLPLQFEFKYAKPVNHFTCSSTWFQSCFNQASYFSHLHKQDRAASFLCNGSIITISFITNPCFFAIPIAAAKLLHPNHGSSSKPNSTPQPHPNSSSRPQHIFTKPANSPFITKIPIRELLNLPITFQLPKPIPHGFKPNPHLTPKPNQPSSPPSH